MSKENSKRKKQLRELQAASRAMAKPSGDVKAEMTKLASVPELSLSIPPARKLVGRIFEEAGLSLSYLVEKLKEGLEADEIWYHAMKDGQVLSETHPDFRTRQKYLEMAFRIREAYPVESGPEQRSALVIALPQPLDTTVEEWNHMMTKRRVKNAKPTNAPVSKVVEAKVLSTE